MAAVDATTKLPPSKRDKVDTLTSAFTFSQRLVEIELAVIVSSSNRTGRSSVDARKARNGPERFPYAFLSEGDHVLFRGRLGAALLARIGSSTTGAATPSRGVSGGVLSGAAERRLSTIRTVLPVNSGMLNDPW